MGKHMTWDEIKTTYPNQWVGLTDVEYEAPNSATILNATVLYTDKSKDDILIEQIETDGRIIARYTNPNGLFQLGVLG